MPTNPRKEPTALTRAKGNKRRASKKELAEREAHEVYAASGEIVAPATMKGKALEMFNAEADYMRRVNKVTGKSFYGETDAAPLQVMVEAHYRYLHYAKREEEARNPDRIRLYNQLKNREAQTEKAYRQALKLDPASRVDFAPAKDGTSDGEDFNL